MNVQGNPNYATQWSVDNGTIVNSATGYIEVVWDAEMTEGQVRLRVENKCMGGETVHFALDVSNKSADMP